MKLTDSTRFLSLSYSVEASKVEVGRHLVRIKEFMYLGAVSHYAVEFVRE